MQLLAAVAGGFGAAYSVCMVIELYRPGLNVAAILPVWLGFGWFIWRGGNMAWVRVWGSMAAATWLFAYPWLRMVYDMVYNQAIKRPEGLSLGQVITWSIGAAAAEMALKIMAALFTGLALLFSLLAGLQYYRVKRRVGQTDQGRKPE